MELQGFYQPEWQAVVDQFLQNYREGDDGAGLALVINNQTVLDISIGKGQNRQQQAVDLPWSSDSLVNVFSASKGLVALCALQLVQQGKLDLHKKLSHYWPEFNRAETSSIRVLDVLCHRSGLSAFHSVVGQQQIFDWAAIIDMLSSETPWWESGSGQGYSPFLFGWLMGELIRRVADTKSFNDYFQQAVAQPLKINCFFGVPDEKLSQVLDTKPLKKLSAIEADPSEADSAALGRIMKADPRGVTNRAFSNPISLMTSTNSLAWRQAQIPAANAHTNALGLARVYGDLVSSSPRLLNQDMLNLSWQEQSFEQDKVLGLPLRFSCGFMLSQANRQDCRYGRGARAFGHPGAGGSLGFADPDYQLGFGYVTQNMGQRILIDERAVKLIDAVYQVLGD